VRLLSSERDKYMHLYNDAIDDLQACKKDLINENKIANYSMAAQSMLKRVETERDTALFDLRNTIKERDSLIDRIKVA
jgi:hypothetical protein